MVAHNQALVDIQAQSDDRNISIQKVGIRDICYPATIHLHCGKISSAAYFDIACMLPADQRGVHMSRFIELLERRKDTISWSAMQDITADCLQSFSGTASVYFSCSFVYFRTKEAPETKLESTMDYKCTFYCARGPDGIEQYIQLVVPVMTLCPCSKALSKQGAHNQRSLCTITLYGSKEPDIDRIIDAIEQSASSPLYSLLKRSDERAVTEQSYARPCFVEDILRNIVLLVQKDYQRYTVDIASEESIHNHNAYAYTESRMP